VGSDNTIRLVATTDTGCQSTVTVTVSGEFSRNAEYHGTRETDAGLGGRPITKRSLHALFRKVEKDDIAPLTFLDLNQAVVDKQLERERAVRRSGPAAEAILRDIGVVAAKIA